jgi:hypothetical protein
MPDRDYECKEPFGVDHGELDGLSPAQCFTLGVEWQMVASEADRRKGFSRPVRIENRERIAALLDRRERVYKLEFMAEDVSESWIWLEVQPREYPDAQ